MLCAGSRLPSRPPACSRSQGAAAFHPLSAEQLALGVLCRKVCLEQPFVVTDEDSLSPEQQNTR